MKEETIKGNEMHKSRKKILLVKPYTPAPSLMIIPPLGLMYLASAVRSWLKDEYKLEILDARLKKMYAQDILSRIIDMHPDVVGLSVLSYEAEEAYTIAQAIKRFNKDILVIMGGPHGTHFYDEVLRNSNIDVAVIGEGEKTFCELINSYFSHEDFSAVKGIAFRKNGQVIKTMPRDFIVDLDEIPFPAWDLINIKEYAKQRSQNNFIYKDKYMVIFTSRGCPYKCIYCHKIFGETFRARSPENIFLEIKTLVDNYSIEEMHISDDIFNFDKERMMKLADLIIFNNIKLKLCFPNGLRADLLDEEMLKKLKAAGTYSISYGMESASPRIQKLIRKNLNIEKALEIIDITDRLKIYSRGFFMLGFPGETLEEMKATINMACNSRLIDAAFFIATAYKNNDLYRMFKLYYPINLEKPNYRYEKYRIHCSEGKCIELRKIQRWAVTKFNFNLRRICRSLLLAPRRNLIKRMFNFIYYMKY